MKVSLIVLAALMSGICACSKDSSTNDNAKPAQEDMKDVTDRSMCSGVTNPNATIYGATWHMRLASSRINSEISYQVNNGSTMITNTCYFSDGASLDVSVTVASQVVGNQYTVMENKDNTNSIQRGGNTYNCSVNANAVSLTYAFAGPCLAMTTNGKTMLMVP